MTKKEKAFLRATVAFTILFATAPVANAMHIMEGYLPVAFCVTWGIICLPFLAAGLISLKKRVKENRKTITLIAMSGAFIFVISSLKIPSVTGSCSHMTGTGLGVDPVGTGSSQCAGDHRIVVPGDLIGSWRTDNIGSEYIFHGDRRTACVVWTL